jgi:hypothetical protein
MSRRNIYSQNFRSTTRRMNMSRMSGCGKSEEDMVKEQVSKIKFDGEKPPAMNSVSDVMGLNRYSSIRDSKINKELPMGNGIDFSVLKKIKDATSFAAANSKTPIKNLNPDKLPGEALKRKLLLRMMKEKETKGSGKKGVKGGFFFLLPFLIAAISGAASVAATGAVAFAGTTAGTAIITAVGTSLASAAVAKITGGKRMKGRGVGEDVDKIVKNTVLKLKDFPLKVQLEIKKGYDLIKMNPTLEVIKKFAESIAPKVRDVFTKKLQTKLKLVEGGRMYGSGQVAKDFENNFADLLVDKLT